MQVIQSKPWLIFPRINGPNVFTKRFGNGDVWPHHLPEICLHNHEPLIQELMNRVIAYLGEFSLL